MQRLANSSRAAILPLVLLYLTVAPARPPQNPGELYERARLLDASNQNLAEAIRLYSQFIAQVRGQRPLAARAQYRIGVIYERLGRRNEARQAFRTLIGRYPEQTDLVRRARSRVGPEASEPGATSVLKKEDPSPDSPFLAVFTTQTEQNISAPVIDSAGRRVYIVTQRVEEPRTREEATRARQAGGRYFSEPSTLVVIDADSLAIIREVPLGHYINDLAINPDNNKLYAAAHFDGHVKVIDKVTFRQQRIPVPGFPTKLGVNPVTNRVYVSSQGFGGNDKLFVIDANTHSVSGPLDLGGVADEVVIDAVDNRIYASAPPHTRVFDGADNSIIRDLEGLTVVVADTTDAVVYARTTQPLDRTLLRTLGARAHEVSAVYDFASRISHVAPKPGAGRAYVTLPDNSQITVVDTAARKEVGRMWLPEGATRIELDERTGNLFLSLSHRAVGVMPTEGLDDYPEYEIDDSFDSSELSSTWKVRGGIGTYSMTERAGHLRVRTASERTGPARRLLLSRRFGGDHWEMDVGATFVTGETGGGRSLIFGVTFGVDPTVGSFDKTAAGPQGVYIQRLRDDWNGCCRGEVMHRIVEESKARVITSHLPSERDSYIWRIARNGRTLTISYSSDGINFVPAGTHTFGPEIDGVFQYFAIGFNSFASNDLHADFDYVRLRRLTPETRQ